MTEQDIINILSKGFLKAPKRSGIGDDAAIVGGSAICSDTMVENVHFDETPITRESFCGNFPPGGWAWGPI